MVARAKAARAARGLVATAPRNRALTRLDARHPQAKALFSELLIDARFVGDEGVQFDLPQERHPPPEGCRQIGEICSSHAATRSLTRSCERRSTEGRATLRRRSSFSGLRL